VSVHPITDNSAVSGRMAATDMALACTSRRWHGGWQPESVGSVRLPAGRFLATPEDMAPAATRGRCSHQRATAVSLRLPPGRVLAATAALGGSATGRCRSAQRAIAETDRLSSRWSLAVLQGLWHRGGGQSAHLHALHSAPDRHPHWRGHGRCQIQRGGRTGRRGDRGSATGANWDSHELSTT